MTFFVDTERLKVKIIKNLNENATSNGYIFEGHKQVAYTNKTQTRKKQSSQLKITRFNNKNTWFRCSFKTGDLPPLFPESTR